MITSLLEDTISRSVLGHWALVVALVTLTSGVGVLWWIIRPQKVSDTVPGPPRHWLLGVSFGEGQDFAHGEIFEWGQWPSLSLSLSRKYNFQTWGGPVINLGFGGAFFNVVSPACLEHILKENFDNYYKGHLTKSFDELVGKAIFTSDGDAWKFHRKIVVRILSRETLHHAADLMIQKLNQVESFLDSLQTEVIDFQDMAYKVIFDVFLELAFGVKLNQLEQESRSGTNDPIQAEMKAFVEAFNEIQHCVHERMNDLLWEWKQRFCIGKRERTIRQCKSVLDRFCYKIIEQAKQQAKEKASQRKDIVSQFLSYAETTTGQPATELELRDFVMTFLMEGRDTTAAALSWTMYELTKHPNYFDMLREEIDRECKGDDFSLDAIQKRLPMTTAVVMESLRLHPTAPDNFRFAKDNDILPDGTEIPAGSLVMFSAYTINHSEQVWGDDADDFNPLRWLQNGAASNPSNFQFPTFNGGPRLCPGKSIALMELKMCLAFLVSKFDFEDANGHSGAYQWRIVMSMKGGFPVRVSRHKSRASSR